jgi:sigma-B regulation protein RsbU (phosphoserine phosphatase)
MKLRRVLYLGGAVLLVLIKLAIDVIGKNVELEIGGLSLFRDGITAGIFVLLYLVANSILGRREQNPMKKLGILLVAMLCALLLTIALSTTSVGGFDAKNLALLPLDYGTLFVALLLSLILGSFAVLTLRLLRDLVFYNRKKRTRSNFLVLTVLMLTAAASTVMMRPLDDSVLTSILFALSIVLALVNSFRLPWIVYLTKREKIVGLVYAFLLFLGFLGINIILAQSTLIGRSLLYYSYPLKQFVLLTMVFGNIYFGMAFISTLFHLPTAEAFDRKRSEVTSLHNLSKLVTQVFDFNELVDSVTTMTLDVCEAKSCWLEMVHRFDEGVPADNGASAANLTGEGYRVRVVAMKNITQEEIDELVPPERPNLREEVMVSLKPVVIDDVTRDGRFVHLKKGKLSVASLVMVPLVSHAGLIGFLYATKGSPFGFVQDDVDVIAAFADQATVAIENSRLIKESLDRERLFREMLVAQDMQKRLLPQAVPRYDTLEIDAVSTPAFEVGGDYYDFVELNDHTIGIVVGDVSGKGVSAAFYMSEVKGIFQALSRMYPSPRDFVIKANEALAGSVDKRSFVSLIYGVLDVRTGQLRLARAGHCPMLLVSGDQVEFIRPGGMGMGLSRGEIFDGAIEEYSLGLREGDLCIFYTDGITEARRGDEEFGYDRLLDVARNIRHESASVIKDEIVEKVKSFADRKVTDDDLTLVVLKWRVPAVRIAS